MYNNHANYVPTITSAHIAQREQIEAMVLEFHNVFQQDINQPITSERLFYRARLINEEAWVEGIPANWNADLEKILDSMGDTLYVLAGTLVTFIDAGRTGHMTDIEIDDLGSSEIPNFIADPLDALHTAREAVNVLRHCATVAGESRSECFDSYVIDSMYVIQWALEQMGVDPVALVSEIHRSNMTKLWPEDAVVDHPDVVYTNVGNGLVLCNRKSDGKVIKPLIYSKADLSPFVAQVKAGPHGSIYGEQK